MVWLFYPTVVSKTGTDTKDYRYMDWSTRMEEPKHVLYQSFLWQWNSVVEFWFPIEIFSKFIFRVFWNLILLKNCVFLKYSGNKWCLMAICSKRNGRELAVYIYIIHWKLFQLEFDLHTRGYLGILSKNALHIHFSYTFLLAVDNIFFFSTRLFSVLIPRSTESKNIKISAIK